MKTRPRKDISPFRNSDANPLRRDVQLEGYRKPGGGAFANPYFHFPFRHNLQFFNPATHNHLLLWLHLGLHATESRKHISSR